MTSLITYKGLTVLSDDNPTGEAGNALQDNFKAIANAINTADPDNIKVGGSLIFTNGGLVYGHMYISSEVIVVISNTDPTEVNDASSPTFIVGELNNITFSDHFLTISKAGRYKIDWSMSAHVALGGATELHGGIMIDGVAIRDAGEAHRTVASLNDTGNFGSLAILDLPNGTEEVSLWVICESSNDVHVIHANISITQVGS